MQPLHTTLLQQQKQTNKQTNKKKYGISYAFQVRFFLSTDALVIWFGGPCIMYVFSLRQF